MTHRLRFSTLAGLPDSKRRRHLVGAEPVIPDTRMILCLSKWAGKGKTSRFCHIFLHPGSTPRTKQMQRLLNCRFRFAGSNHVAYTILIDRAAGGISTCAMRLRKGGVRTIGRVTACIREGFSNFISVYKPCGKSWWRIRQFKVNFVQLWPSEPPTVQGKTHLTYENTALASPVYGQHSSIGTRGYTVLSGMTSRGLTDVPPWRLCLYHTIAGHQQPLYIYNVTRISDYL